MSIVVNQRDAVPAIGAPDKGDGAGSRPSALDEESTLLLTNALLHLAPETRIALVRDVRQAAKQCFLFPPAPRTAELLQLMRDLRRALAKAGTIPTLSPYHPLWAALGVAEEEVEHYLTSPDRLEALLRAGIPEYELNPETARDRAGPRRDPRIDRFAYHLAVIYARHVGERPRFTRNKDDYDYDSAFARFAEEAFHQFHPGGPPGPSQLSEALRGAVAVERDVVLEDPDLLRPRRARP